MSELITILTFTYPHEVHVAKSLLESEGIQVHVKDEFVSQVVNFYSNAIGGVKLQVMSDDKERSLEILAAAGFMQEEKPVSEEIETFSYKYIDVCPYCNSDEVVKKKQAGYTIILSILLLGFPLLFFKRKYYCFDCNKEWKVKGY